jgi:response regulator NasT
MRVVVADGDPAHLDHLRRVLEGLGHEALPAPSGERLVELCLGSRPDLAVADSRLPGLNTLAAVEAVHRERPTPFILLAAAPEAAARTLPEAVMAVLFKPVRGPELAQAARLAVERFRVLQGLAQEVADLQRALEERKLVERAKGTVQRRTGVSEDEAYRRLRRYASDQNLKLAEVARRVLAAEEVLHALDSPE